MKTEEDKDAPEWIYFNFMKWIKQWSETVLSDIKKYRKKYRKNIEKKAGCNV